MMAGPAAGMFSIPSMSNLAYGMNSGWVKLSANLWMSMLTTGIFATAFPDDDDPFDDRSSVGQRLAAAMTAIRGSGLTANGNPTAANNGVSYTLSLYA